jgi:hypothetical protein
MIVFALFGGHTVQASLLDDEMIVINAGFADYDGKKITLKDQVVVEHEIGTIAANQVVLTPAPEADKKHFGILQMREDVKISLREGGQLCCSRADVDYQQMKGTFYGTSQQEYVVYTESCKGKEQDVSLIVKGRRMDVHLNSEGPADSPKSRIDCITAEGNVTLNYNHDMIAVADHAKYQRLEHDLETSSLPGLIQLNASPQNGLCCMTNRNGDTIRASQICVDTIHRQLTFSNPRGTINLADTTPTSEGVAFSSGTLLWDQPSRTLVLKEHITINQKGLGTLETEHEVRVIQDVVDGRKQLALIESPSDTLLSYEDDKKNLNHTLNCPGLLRIDHKYLKAHAESIRDAEGKVVKPVVFQDSRGKITADQLDVSYVFQDHQIALGKIILAGNVQVFSHLTPSNEETSSVLQYALADIVEYSPGTQEMLFKALEDRRILFYDKTNNLQVSAPGMKLQRDIHTKKQSIQGIGDVRFSFIEREFQQLRERFSFDKHTDKEGN